MKIGVWTSFGGNVVVPGYSYSGVVETSADMVAYRAHLAEHVMKIGTYVSIDMFESLMSRYAAGGIDWNGKIESHNISGFSEDELNQLFEEDNDLCFTVDGRDFYFVELIKNVIDGTIFDMDAVISRISIVNAPEHHKWVVSGTNFIHDEDPEFAMEEFMLKICVIDSLGEDGYNNLCSKNLLRQD